MRSTSSATSMRWSTPIRTGRRTCRSGSSPDRRRTPSSPMSSASAPRASTAGQGPFEPFTVAGTTTAIEGTPAVEVCSDGFCDTFSDFVVEDGRLQSFQLNGLAIDDRVASPAKPTEFGDVGIEVIGGFERITVDELAVVIGVDPAGETLEVAWDEVVYVNPSGDEIAVDLLASAYPAGHRAAPRRTRPAGRPAISDRRPRRRAGGAVHQRLHIGPDRGPRRGRRAASLASSDMCGIIAIVSRPPTRATPEPGELLDGLDQALALCGDPIAVAVAAEAGRRRAARTPRCPGARRPSRTRRRDHCPPRSARSLRRRRRARRSPTLRVSMPMHSNGPARRRSASATCCGRFAGTACAPPGPSTTSAGRSASVSARAGYLSIQQALSAIDRMEVRGRDSAGLHVFVWNHSLDVTDPSIASAIAGRTPDPLFQAGSVRLLPGAGSGHRALLRLQGGRRDRRTR